jgi:hypothetical protein
MTRDEPLDDGLTKSLFSGISRPRPGSQKPEYEVQTSSAAVQSTASVIQTPTDDKGPSSSELQTPAPIVQTSEDDKKTSPSETQSSSDVSQTSPVVVQRSEVDKRAPAPIVPISSAAIRSSVSEAQTSEVDVDALEQALQEAERYPKVTAYSPELAAVMRYNEITVRRYRISTEAAKMLEDQVMEKYPEIWSEVSKRIQHKKRRK